MCCDSPHAEAASVFESVRASSRGSRMGAATRSGE